MKLEQFIIPVPEDDPDLLRLVYDRGVDQFGSHLTANWAILSTGAYIRLLLKRWPPRELGWFSLAPFSPDDQIVPVSVGMFQQTMSSIVPEARKTGETWRIRYGKCGAAGSNSRWPPDTVVAHFRFARPAEYVGRDIPAVVHKPRVGPLQVIPEIGGDIAMKDQWGHELQGEELAAAKAEQRGGHLNRSHNATREAREAAAEALDAAREARQAVAEAVETARQAQREAAGLRELCTAQAADLRALAALFTRLTSRVMSQPPGDEPTALAMLLTARDGRKSMHQVLALAGFGADHPGVERLVMDDMWQVPAPAQAEVPEDQYPAWWRDRDPKSLAPPNWEQARYGPPPDEQSGSMWEEKANVR